MPVKEMQDCRCTHAARSLHCQKTCFLLNEQLYVPITDTHGYTVFVCLFCDILLQPSYLYAVVRLHVTPCQRHDNY